MNSFDPEKQNFPDPDSLPPRMPEVLTEIQQGFVDFVKRNTAPNPNQTFDSYDNRLGELKVSPTRHLVPVDYIRLVNYVCVETEYAVDYREPFPVPFNYSRVELHSDILGDITALTFDSNDGWRMWIPDSESVPIREEQAKPIVDSLLDLEQQGALSQK